MVRACALTFSALAKAGSSPSDTRARAALARFRASSGSTVSTVPSVSRRCFVPTRYCASQVRFPPARSLRPKPGRSSSKTIASALPGGIEILARFPFVRRTAVDPRFWEAIGKQPCAQPCTLLIPIIRVYRRFSKGFRPLRCFPISYAHIDNRTFNQDVPGSSPGALTRREKALTSFSPGGCRPDVEIGDTVESAARRSRPVWTARRRSGNNDRIPGSAVRRRESAKPQASLPCPNRADDGGRHAPGHQDRGGLAVGLMAGSGSHRACARHGADPGSGLARRSAIKP